MEYPRSQRIELDVPRSLDIVRAVVTAFVDDWRGLPCRLVRITDRCAPLPVPTLDADPPECRPRPALDRPLNPAQDQFAVVAGAIWLTQSGARQRDDRLYAGAVRITATSQEETKVMVWQNYWADYFDERDEAYDHWIPSLKQFFDLLVDALVDECGATGRRVMDWLYPTRAKEIQVRPTARVGERTPRAEWPKTARARDKWRKVCSTWREMRWEYDELIQEGGTTTAPTLDELRQRVLQDHKISYSTRRLQDILHADADRY